jgi:hypothetical protein
MKVLKLYSNNRMNCQLASVHMQRLLKRQKGKGVTKKNGMKNQKFSSH